MTPQRLDEIFKNYRVTKARMIYLTDLEKRLDRRLRILKGEMVEDMQSFSQAITGMPHGSGVGDPTGRLGVDIASGKVTPFIKQVEEELTEARSEMIRIGPDVNTVEVVLQALGDREREVLVLKIIDDRDWGDTVDQMNGLHNGAYSKRTLQRLLDRALEKAYEVVK